MLKTYWYCSLGLEYFLALSYLLNSISPKFPFDLHLLYQELLGPVFNLDGPEPSLCLPAILKHSSVILLGTRFCDFPKQDAHFHQCRSSPSLVRSKYLIVMHGQWLNEQTPKW